MLLSPAHLNGLMFAPCVPILLVLQMEIEVPPTMGTVARSTKLREIRAVLPAV